MILYICSICSDRIVICAVWRGVGRICSSRLWFVNITCKIFRVGAKILFWGCNIVTYNIPREALTTLLLNWLNIGKENLISPL